MWKKWVTVVCAALIVGVLFFHRPIMHLIIETSIKRCFEKCSTAPVTFHAIEKDDHHIVFHHLKLPLSHSEGVLQAEKLSVEYELSMLKRELTLNIHIQAPHLNTIAGSEDLYVLLKKLISSTSSLIAIKGSLTISDGELIVKDPSGTESQKLTLNCYQQWGDLPIGNHLISLYDGEHANHLHFEVKGNEQALEVKSSISQLNASHAFKLIHSVAPSLSLGDVKSGLVNMDMTVFLPKDLRPYTDGYVHVENLNFHHPDLGLELQIGEVEGYLSPSFLPQNSSQVFFNPALTGSLEFKKKNRLKFTDAGVVFGQIDQFVGQVLLQPEDSLQVQLNGILGEKHAVSKGALTAQLTYPNFQKFTIEGTIIVDNPKEQVSSIQFHAKDFGLNEKTISVQLQNVKEAVFEFLDSFLHKYVAVREERIQLLQGSISASVDVLITDGEMQDIKIQNLEAKNLLCYFSTWEVIWGSDLLSGNLELPWVNLGTYPNFLGNCNANLAVHNGFFQVDGFDQSFWKFSHIDTQLSVKQGVIEKSLASGELAGLKGSAEIDWLSPKEVMRLKLHGEAKDIAQFLPQDAKQAIDHNFPHDRVSILADVSRILKGFHIQGHALFKEEDMPLERSLNFGFDVEKSKEGSFFAGHVKKYWDEISPLLSKNADFSFPVALLELYSIQEELGIAGLVIKNGSFNMQNVPLQRYLSPFLFRQNQFTLKGIAHIFGKFDHTSIAFNYDPYELALVNPAVTIEVPHSMQDEEQSQAAFHYYDFLTGNHFGTLPVRNGSYFDHRNGLFYTDIHADVLFTGDKIRLPEIDGFSNGVYFAGMIEIDYSSPLKGVFDLKIKPHTMLGKVSQIQHVLLHFDPNLPFLQIPLEGNVLCQNESCLFDFHFSDESYSLDAKIKGELIDGVARFEHVNLDLQDISLKFDYDHQANQFTCTDVQGILLVGQPDEVEEYLIGSDKLCMKDFSQNLIEFDLWVGDRNRDIIRLAGHTEFNKETGEIPFVFDEKITHFGEIHPTSLQLILKDWSRVELFNLNFQARLSTLLHDVKRFSRTGLLFLSEPLLQKLHEIQLASGNFQINVGYDGGTARFFYQFSGQNVTFEDYQFKQVLMQGYKLQNQWMIEQLQLDQLSLSANFTKQEMDWKIHFLGIRYGKSLLAGLEGEFKEGSSQIEARVNLLEIHLAHLKEMENLDSRLAALPLQGIFRGTGNIILSMQNPLKEWQIEAKLDSHIRSLEWNGIKFGEAEHFITQLLSNQKISFQNINSSWLIGKDVVPLAIQNMEYQFLSDEFVVDHLKLNLSKTNLISIKNFLATHFKDHVQENVLTFLSSLKQDGLMPLSLNYFRKNEKHQCSFELPEGDYYVYGQPHHLNQIKGVVNQDELSLKAQYQLNHKAFWILANVNFSDLNAGKILIQDREGTTQNPLAIFWKQDPGQGFYVQNISGYFSGLTVNLARNKNLDLFNSGSLEGEVKIDCAALNPLLPDDIALKVKEWELGTGYTLKGIWNICGEDSHIQFQGDLLGSHFKMKGYIWQKLHSSVTYLAGKLQALNTTISDEAAHVFIPRLDYMKNENQEWFLHIPHMTVENLIPSMLCEEGLHTPKFRKPLTITHIVFTDIKGVTSDSKNLTGYGYLNFKNHQKNNLEHTIFAIPVEILSRIGLTTAALNPVTGTVQFTLQDGKFNLIKFKDMFSEKRLSKFYLHDKFPSYMDFDGNLFVQVRMKQSTLLFKLAELFTVTVKGTLTKPTYTLQKQKPLAKDEVIEVPTQ